MYETILIPTDGSKAARQAFDEALELAKTYGATVHGLYVVDTNVISWSAADDGTGIGGDITNITELLKEEGERATDQIREAAREYGVDVVTAVEDGIPYRTILEYVDEHDIDLIVMGTHGHRGLDRYLLGSTTDRVIRHATVPVLAVRMHRETD